MDGKRIKHKGLYLVLIPQGISGFPMPSIPAMVTGARLKRDLLLDYTGPIPGGCINSARFRLEDGHLPEYQPEGGIFEASAWLEANPMSAAYFVDKG